MPFNSVVSQVHYNCTIQGQHLSVFPVSGMMTIQQEAEKNLQRGEMSEDSVAAFFEAKQGQIMEHLWKLNVADIENTLTRVVDRVSLTLLTCQ